MQQIGLLPANQFVEKFSKMLELLKQDCYVIKDAVSQKQQLQSKTAKNLYDIGEFTNGNQIISQLPVQLEEIQTMYEIILSHNFIQNDSQILLLVYKQVVSLRQYNIVIRFTDLKFFMFCYEQMELDEEIRATIINDQLFYNI